MNAPPRLALVFWISAPIGLSLIALPTRDEDLAGAVAGATLLDFLACSAGGVRG